MSSGDLDAIATPCDFLGINYYMRTVVRSDRIPEAENAPRTVHLAPKSEWTEMGWEVWPKGLSDILVRVHKDYAPSRIFVTENGASYSTPPAADGRVPDVDRVRYLQGHLAAVHRALELGVPLEGYFVWSLLDNFEWERGYTQRFGITWVDYATRQRIAKDSALWYSRVIVDGAVEIPEEVRSARTHLRAPNLSTKSCGSRLSARRLLATLAGAKPQADKTCESWENQITIGS